jgi:methylmalonyl-CoA mutase N-terminal domain/subunit
MPETKEHSSSAEESVERWQNETLDPALNKRPERKKSFQTVSLEEVGRLYTPADTEEIDFSNDVSFPGEFPYTRGIHPTGYRGKLWTMRQFAGFSTPEETNARFKYLLEQGQTGLSVAYDLPTLMGYDADHPRSRGEVGREGVAVSTIEDMERLFDRIPLDEVTTSMTVNCSASVLLAMYLAIAQRRGISWAKLGGTIQNDMLKEFIAQKEWISPPEPSVRVVADMIEFCAAEVPRWHAVSISGYHIREAGATAIQELAFTLADGIAYVEEVVRRGRLTADDFGHRLSFFFDVHNDFFEEIAKFRAARRLWARIMTERFGGNAKSAMLRFHTQTGGATLTAQQPENNFVRTALEALAAVLGGTQSLHTNSYDEALALPTEHSATIALRTQQIIAFESGVTATPDPLAGSYFVESLTNELERQAYEYFERIDQLGGVVAAIKENFFQREIAEASFRYQSEVEAGQRVIVGLNRYELEGETQPEILRIDPALERKQIDRVQALRAGRDSALVEAALAGLKEGAAKDDVNLMPLIVDASRAYVTMGEMCDALREVWGVWRETPVF